MSFPKIRLKYQKIHFHCRTNFLKIVLQYLKRCSSSLIDIVVQNYITWPAKEFQTFRPLIKRTKRISPLGLPDFLSLEGSGHPMDALISANRSPDLGRFAAPNTIAKQSFTPCASVHTYFYFIGNSFGFPIE